MKIEEAAEVIRMFIQFTSEKDKLIQELKDKLLNLESKITQDVEQPVWIPVTERIPTEEDGWGKYGEILAILKNGKKSIIRYYPNAPVQYFTHWAKIVEPK